jgi:predicted AlkP superfamily phosphohydrolase/phosphomutase
MSTGGHIRPSREPRPRRWRLIATCALALQALDLVLEEGGAGGAVRHAYIGPGAGIALVGSFFAVFFAFFSSAIYFITYPIRLLWRSLRGRRALGRASAKRVVVLGLDGLEPTIVERLMSEGRLPNLSRLREQGSYSSLGTTFPPLSPVAWSSFATGANPGKHNIFDFIARDPAEYRPVQSSIRIREARRKLRLGRLTLPLARPEIRLLRKSKPFWSVLGDSGIFSAVIRVPITFPPDRFHGVQLSAMCVPDLRGTHGTFSYYTSAESSGSTTDGDVGGDVIRVDRSGDTVRSFVRGPGHPLRRDRREMRVPFAVTRRAGGSMTLRIDGKSVALEPDRLTDWVRITFRGAGGLVRITGLCRFLLLRFDSEFAMYCTPVQLDPRRPAMPISHPGGYASYLAKLQGPFATLGLAEDTWALSESRIDEDAFLAQSYDIHAERESMFFDALERVRRGSVVCVFDAPDRIQHMFWRFLEDDHPALGDGDRERHRGVIPEMYRRMDDLVGRTLEAIDDDTVLFVMSDHGFKPFRRCVDLNAWLLENGYLALRDGAERPGRTYLADVDWSATRAYALGLAGIFLNVSGREGRGVVPPEEAGTLAREICERLTGLADPATGEPAIREAVTREAVYRGPYRDEAPDVVVGYAVGYRVSWDSVIGKCGAEVLSDNTKAWSGDHCVHPSLVPGILFCNRPLATDAARIIDVAPTTLDIFGVPVPAYMDGVSLLCREPAA